MWMAMPAPLVLTRATLSRDTLSYLRAPGEHHRHTTAHHVIPARYAVYRSVLMHPPIFVELQVDDARTSW